MSWSLTTETAIKKLAEGLHVGSTKYYKCIFCNAEHESKLSITRKENGIYYHCFRAKCGARGVILNGSGVSNNKVDTFVPKFYTGFTTSVPEEIINEVQEETEILLPSFVKYEPSREALVFPCFDMHYHIIGHIIKPLKNKDKKYPKYIKYPITKDSYSFYSYADNVYSWGTHSQCIIVEDLLSSYKVGEYGISMALLGTNLSPRGLKDLINIQPSNIVIMLDPGAEDAAMKVAEKVRPFFETRVVFNDIDPKYVPYSELSKIL